MCLIFTSEGALIDGVRLVVSSDYLNIINVPVNFPNIICVNTRNLWSANSSL